MLGSVLTCKIDHSYYRYAWFFYWQILRAAAQRSSVQVSDTTGDATCTAAKYIIVLIT